MDINSLYWILLTLSMLMLCECGLTPPPFTKFEIVTAPHDVTTTIGQTLQLPCQATYGGQPPEFYSWEKNGDSFPIWSYGTGTGRFLANGTLQIDNVSSRGESAAFGTFRCIAEHIEDAESLRIATPAVYVTEASMTDFTVYPTELNLKEGETAMFKCNIKADPVARYEWSRDGVQLTSSSRIVIHQGAQVLEIRQVTVLDSGNYRCKATNEFTERASSSSTLLVTNLQDDSSSDQGSAPDFIMEPWHTEVIKGNSATLFCAVNGSDSEGNLPTVSWLFNGRAIDTSSSSHYEIVGSGSLKIKNSTKEQQGTYTCRGENLQDVSDSEANLVVMVPPYFVKRPVDTYASVLVDISLDCDIRGSPAPRVTWYKNSDQITTTNYFSVIGRRLKISNLMVSDSGYYQCVGINSAGKVHAVAQLIVLSSEYTMPDSYNVTGSVNPNTAPPTDSSLPPAPINLRSDVVSLTYITVVWSIPVTVTTPVEFTVNTTRLDNDQQRFRIRSYNTTSTDYTADGLQPDTEYHIQVSSFNRNGRSINHASLVVKTRPEIQVPSEPLNLKAWALSATSVRAAWDAPRESNGVITNYRVYYYDGSQSRENYKETRTYTALLEDLNPHTVYYIRVVASNVNGMGDPSNEIDVMTLSAKPSERPQDVTLVTTGVTSLLLRWEEPPIGTHNGLLTGYKIKWRLKNGPDDERPKFDVVDATIKALELQDLRPNTDYQVRIAAVNINGTGVWTRWMSAATSSQELNELRVPGKPKYLQTRAFARDMIVSWAPADDGVFIRGYKLGYGIATPDEHWINELEPGTQIYTLTNLNPHTIYVLQIIAFNNAGESQPTIQSDTTDVDDERSSQSDLTAPTEVRVNVHSAYSVLVYWYDNTLGPNQKISDNRYYTVKYNAESYEAQRRTEFVNSSNSYVQIDGLRPYTKYSFSVKVTKDNRQSSFSLTARNKTYEAPPSNSPEDLTITDIESRHGYLMVSWQPPSRPNGKIMKYIIYSTTDSRTPLNKWIIDSVDGVTLNYEFGPVTRNTLYFFKIAANNSRGSSPRSDMQVFQTAEDFGIGGTVISYSPGDGGSHSGNGMEGTSTGPKQPSAQTLTIIIAVVSVVTAVAIAALLAIYCKKCILNNKNRPNLKASNQAPKGVRPGKEVDLWINNDGMEMRNLTPAQRQHLEIDENTSMLQSHSHMDIGSASMADDNVFEGPPRYSTLGRQRPVFVTQNYRDAMPRAAVQPMSAERPLFPRTQFTSNNYGSTPRVHLADSHPGSEPYPHQTPHMNGSLVGGPHASAFHAPMVEDTPPPRPPPMEGRGPPLRSFSIPAPPSHNIPKNFVKPQPIVQVPSDHSDPPSNTSSLKRPPRPPYTSIKHPRTPNNDDNLKLNMKNGSTEQLSSEMAHLDNIMQDLNAMKHDFEVA